MPYTDKEQQRQSEAKYRATRRAWLEEQKKDPCVDCGGTFPPECMDFDHADDGQKHFTVSQKLYNRSLDRVKAELEKCELVCANCHRIRTKKRGQYGFGPLVKRMPVEPPR